MSNALISQASTGSPGLTRRAPSPPGLPLVGHLIGMVRDPLGMMTKGLRDHGEVVLYRFGPYRYFVLSGPDVARHVLVDRPENYVKSKNYRGLKVVLGNGLVTSEGEFWKRQRKLAQPAFHHKRLAGFAETMAHYTSDMLMRWATIDATRSFDIHDEMTRLTFRIVGKTLFDVDLHQESDSISERIRIVIDWAQKYAESVVRLPPWVPTPSNLAFGRAKRALDRLVFGIIEERRKDRRDHGDLLSMLMEVTDESGDGRMDNQQLRDEVMTLIIAGLETTANALAYTFHLLSQHPGVSRQLEQEIDRVLGDRAPSFEDLPRLEYTGWVVQESMRLLPPVWNVERDALDDDVIGGYSIPKGSTVAIAAYTLHRNPRHWDNPEGFDPERFSPARSKDRNKHAYLPFGGGPRVCIGNAFAMMEAKLILATVVQRYRLTLIPGFRLELDPSITLRPRSGIPMTRRERSAVEYGRDGQPRREER